MLGKTYTLIFIVQPVHLVLCIREFGVEVSPEHFASVVRVLFHISPQIKICDIGICRVQHTRPFLRQHADQLWFHDKFYKQITREDLQEFDQRVLE